MYIRLFFFLSLSFPSFLPFVYFYVFIVSFRFLTWWLFAVLFSFLSAFFLFPRLSKFFSSTKCFFPFSLFFLMTYVSLSAIVIYSHCFSLTPTGWEGNNYLEREKKNWTNERTKTKRWQLHSLPTLLLQPTWLNQNTEAWGVFVRKQMRTWHTAQYRLFRSFWQIQMHTSTPPLIVLCLGAT